MKINVSKTVSMANILGKNAIFKIGSEKIERIDKFIYLNITSLGSALEDAQDRVRKVKVAFVQLNKIWSSKEIHWKPNSNVKSVLLYACGTWLLSK